jgi:hypothetical protein
LVDFGISSDIIEMLNSLDIFWLSRDVGASLNARGRMTYSRCCGETGLTMNPVVETRNTGLSVCVSSSVIRFYLKEQVRPRSMSDEWYPELPLFDRFARNIAKSLKAVADKVGYGTAGPTAKQSRKKRNVPNG